MIETLNNLDTQCFYWINSHHSPFLDTVMWSVSQHLCWVAVLTLTFLLVTLRYEPKKWWIIVLMVVLCFFLADRGSVVLFKHTICRPRPCHVLENVRMYNTKCGGMYGFVSSHAANVLAIVVVLISRYKKFRNKYPIGITIATFCWVLWVILICYSRVYLGKHYPGDILGGALFGLIVGYFVVWFFSLLGKILPSHKRK